MSRETAQFIELLSSQPAVVELASQFKLPKGWVYYVREYETADMAVLYYRARYKRFPPVVYVIGSGVWMPTVPQPGATPDELR